MRTRIDTIYSLFHVLDGSGEATLKRIEYYEQIMELFKFKTILDEQKNEFVVFSRSNCNSVRSIKDKTEFQAYENHVHLIHNLKKDEFYQFIPVAQVLGQTLLNCLRWNYPDKQFMVYVSLHLRDSVIIRFHQKWENEEPYCNPSDFKSEKEKVFVFET